MKKIKVLIIDDSAFIRGLLQDLFSQQSDMEVVGAAPDPIHAWDLIRSRKPDVLTLDVEMPRMNGVDFLEKLMRLHPLPVVMVSSSIDPGSALAQKALALGAVDFISLSKAAQALPEIILRDLLTRIRVAAQCQPKVAHALDIPPAHTADVVLPFRKPASVIRTEKLIVVGASTGGTDAIKEFLLGLPAHAPAVLITQHMPEMFTRSFANRLNSLAKITVKEAEQGERILPRHAYIAPGHSHMLIRHTGSAYAIELSKAPAVNRHRPSVDVLFRSAANCAGSNAVGVILTGMGKDGANGLAEMKTSGAYTLAQDEQSCVVFGMPKEAIALGAADEVLPLHELAARVIALTNRS